MKASKLSLIRELDLIRDLDHPLSPNMVLLTVLAVMAFFAGVLGLVWALLGIIVR